MPLLLQKEVAEKTNLGIWKIEESPEWFRAQLKLDDRETKLIDSIKHPQRRLHWLSSRVLMRMLMNNPDSIIQLENDALGKPVINNFPVNISISHSAELSALMLSEKFEVGIDIEKIDSKIERIHKKFLSSEEVQQLEDETRLRKLFVYWCAKEAMYKWHGRKQLDFREHLSVENFPLANAGSATGHIIKNEEQYSLKIFFEELYGYMMAYTFAAP